MVRIRVIDSLGTVRHDSGDIELAAGQIARWSLLGQFIGEDGYCRFTVEGDKTSFRQWPRSAVLPGATASPSARD